MRITSFGFGQPKQEKKIKLKKRKRKGGRSSSSDGWLKLITFTPSSVAHSLLHRPLLTEPLNKDPFGK